MLLSFNKTNPLECSVSSFYPIANIIYVYFLLFPYLLSIFNVVSIIYNLKLSTNIERPNSLFVLNINLSVIYIRRSIRLSMEWNLCKTGSRGFAYVK